MNSDQEFQSMNITIDDMPEAIVQLAGPVLRIVLEVLGASLLTVVATVVIPALVPILFPGPRRPLERTPDRPARLWHRMLDTVRAYRCHVLLVSTAVVLAYHLPAIIAAYPAFENHLLSGELTRIHLPFFHDLGLSRTFDLLVWVVVFAAWSARMMPGLLDGYGDEYLQNAGIAARSLVFFLGWLFLVFCYGFILYEGCALVWSFAFEPPYRTK